MARASHRRRTATALALGAALALGGCSLTGGDESERGDDRGGQGSGGGRAAPGDTEPQPGEPTEAGPIRAWNAALNAGDFDKAASFFAENALVEQVGEVRLRGRRDAIEFNRSLPCRSEVTDVDDEGPTTLVAFRLLPGRGGACGGGGVARVRFRVRDGKFEEWRQLTEPAQPPGQIA
ncbi:MAG: nuclear transport factor 2 family protein [Thermoleophilaceae bacterium]